MRKKEKKPKVIAFMNAYSQGKSGGDVVFIEIAKRLGGYDKLIITSLLGKKLCQRNGVKGNYLITTRELEFKNVAWTYLQRIIKVLRLKLELGSSDVFLGTSDFLPDVLPAFFLKIKNDNNRWVQHIFHLIPSSRKIPFLAQRLSFNLIKRKADLIVVDNTLLKKELIRLGFPSRKIFINYPGIDLDYLKSVRPKEENAYEGVFMAQLRPQKGIFDLLKIWKVVVDQLPRARLGIIGKGPEKVLAELKREIGEMRLKGNIDLLGYLPDDEAFGIIKASKVFVFPSHEEGFGIAALEAQAMGLPVVAWDLPVFAEIFPRGMIKVKMGQVNEFANNVINLLRANDFYLRISKKAESNSSRFSWESAAKREAKFLALKE